MPSVPNIPGKNIPPPTLHHVTNTHPFLHSHAACKEIPVCRLGLPHVRQSQYATSLHTDNTSSSLGILPARSSSILLRQLSPSLLQSLSIFSSLDTCLACLYYTPKPSTLNPKRKFFSDTKLTFALKNFQQTRNTCPILEITSALQSVCPPVPANPLRQLQTVVP